MPKISSEVLEQAADWALILRHDEPDAATHAAFRDWLAQSPSMRRDGGAQAVFQSFGRLPPGLGRQVLDQMAGDAAAHPDRRHALLMLAGVTGTALAGGMLAWRKPWQKWNADVATTVGERRALVLPDASELVLNTDSAADIVYGTAERRIRLRSGELLLTSHPDPAPVARPLLVTTDAGEVQALGTRFSVRQLTGSVRVTVFRDAVEIRPSAGPATRLSAGQQVEFNRAGVGPVRAADDSAAIWEQGMLLAQDMPLAEVVTEMARNRHGILRCDPRVAAIRVSGAISLADTDRGLELLARTLPVRIQQRTPWWVVVAPRG